MSLRVAGGDSDIIKKTEPHRPLRGGVMARRTHWQKSVARLPAHHRVNRPARRARGPQGSIEGVKRNNSIRIQVGRAFPDDSLDVLEMLGRVTGLHIATCCFLRLDLEKFRPQFRVRAQRVHHDFIARW